MRDVFVCYCAATSTNKAILASDRMTANSKTFLVKGIKNPGFLDHHLEIDMEEID